MVGDQENVEALFVLGCMRILLIANIPRKTSKKEGFQDVLLKECIGIVSLMLLCGRGVYPNMTYSLPDTANSLTVDYGSSTDVTFRMVRSMGMIGVPIVLVCILSIIRISRTIIVKLPEKSCQGL